MRHWTESERKRQSELIHRWKPWERTKYRKTNGWSEQRRSRHRELIHRWKPWLKSTGPKSKNGKAVVSRNALKHGARSVRIRKVDAIIAEFRESLKNLEVP
jgi:hypothetical protein